MQGRNPWKNKQLLQYLLFWITVFICSCIANMEFHETWWEMFIIYGFKVLVQIAVAIFFLKLILPLQLKQLRISLLLTHLLPLLLIIHVVTLSWQYFVLEPQFPKVYAYCIAYYEDWSFFARLLDGVTIFFKNPAYFFPPALVLVAIKYLQEQQQLAEIKEQKSANELKALKHQMNPHFLFNTLNNLYSLAVKKSDQVPEVIGKLSEILDYMLYRCHDRFVPLGKEVELINNYLALEKIRYGKRVCITFDYQTDNQLRIAPLLLLHFVENAFKHGVTHQLSQAKINIHLRTTNNNKNIYFSIENSIPLSIAIDKAQINGIGLKNIRRQLNLLYPDHFQLQLHQTNKKFGVQLNIQTL